jgi:hypothetical protein
MAKPLKALKKLSLKESQSRLPCLSIAETTLSAKSNIKGRPLTFIKGHNVCYATTRMPTSMNSSSSESKGPSPPLRCPVAAASPTIDLTSPVMTGTPIATGEASADFCFITFPKGM